MVMYELVDTLGVLLTIYLIQAVLVVILLTCNTDTAPIIKTRRQFFICLIPYIWMYAFMQLICKQFKKLK